MSDELLLFEFLEDDSESSNRRRHQRKISRECHDPFEDLDNVDFIKRYRLSKDLVYDLCDEMRPLFKVSHKSTDLSVETKVLTALSFFATGSYQRPTGDISAHSLAQQTVSQVLAEVTACLNSAQMRKKYICFPNSIEKRNNIRTRFYEKYQFPGVLGCIDCTHVAIVRPSEHEERYYCRKNYHSLNVQLICDADMQIISVDSSFGGATHDAFIWNAHPVKEHMEHLEQTWFLGDSGYPLRKYLMTPIINAAPGSPESYYTDKQVGTRNVVERTIGLLKARFRCLLVHRMLHYQPQKAASIINACAILHNICNKGRVPEPTITAESMLQEAQLQLSENDAERAHPSNPELQEGVSARNRLVQRLWDDRRI